MRDLELLATEIANEASDFIPLDELHDLIPVTQRASDGGLS